MKLPQISLRELFLLVALTAMGCGWMMQHQHWLRAVDKTTSERDLAERRLDMLVRNLGEHGTQITFSDGRKGGDLSMTIQHDKALLHETMREEGRHRLLESAIRNQGYDVQWIGDDPSLVKRAKP
jgi:hypothetical protein